MRENLLFIVVGSFIVGVLFESLAGTTYTYGLFLSGTLGSIGIVLTLFLVVRRKTEFIFLALVFIFLGLGIFRVALSDLREKAHVLDIFIDQQVVLAGMVIEDPDERLTNTKVTLRTDTLLFGTQEVPLATKILITTSPYITYHYGDELRVKGKLGKPTKFLTDTGREFVYGAYLGKENIYYTLSFAEIEVVSQKNGNRLKGALLTVKNRFMGSINKNLRQPEGALLAGILLGEKAGLGEELEKEFRTAGLVHVLVLSGYNITIVVNFFLWIFGVFRKPRLALLLSAIAIFLFALLVGFEATVVRASLMALLVIVAKLSGRPNAAIRTLAIAGFLMILHNPKILLHDISFQLSFLATLGLIYISPLLENRCTWLTDKFHIRENFVTTVSAQIAVLPLILFYMGELSVVAIVVNVLVLATIPFAMLTGFLMSLVGLFSGALATIFMFPTYFLLAYQITLVHFFANLPIASIVLPQFPWWGMAIGYGLTIFTVLKISDLTK